MHRRSILTSTGLASVLAAGIAPAVHAQASVRWRLASSFPATQEALFGAATLFAQKVRQLSDGRFEIQVHPAGDLVPAAGVIDALQRGVLEAVHTAAHLFCGLDETFALGGAIPFGLNSRQMTAWSFEGQGSRLMNEFYARYNIIHFPCGNTGARLGGWLRRPVATVRDLKGLRFSIDGLAAQVLARLGGVPSRLTGPQACQALSEGRLDAVESFSPHEDLKLGLHKGASVCHVPGWWEGGRQLGLFIQRRAFDRLSLEHRAIVQAASAHAHLETQACSDVINAIALKQLVAGGACLRPFPNDVMTEAFLQAKDLYHQLSARNPSWRKVYADYSRFRADQNLWFRFGEARFDSFMQAQSL